MQVTPIPVRIAYWLRHFGFLDRADHLRMHWQKWQFRQKNKLFRQKNAEIVLPPDPIMYETFNLDYHKYYHGGRAMAQQLLDYYQEQKKVLPASVLDWGCGPARIIRHMPDLLDPKCFIAGCDFNADTIEWCKAHIPGVRFAINDLEPPLPFPPEHFEFVYGISILTHLSAARHQNWIDELFRVLHKGGILLLTSQGDIFQEKLLPQERKIYQSGQLVVRDRAREGRRTFSAFHPPSQMKSLFSGFTIRKHIAGSKHSGYLEQDIWILEKE